MSKTTSHPGDPRIVAAFQPVGGAWHAVIGRLDAQRTVYVDARVFSASSPSSAFSDWLAGHNVGKVISVLPGSSILCRTCALPNGSPQQLESALRLQAETQLLGSVPTHRLATAVLQPAAGESNRSGIIVGWPESSEPPVPAISSVMSFAPVIAALAALLHSERPSEPIVLVDRKDGSIALALTHTNGAVFRAARIDSAASDRGVQSILRTLTETALSVGHTGQYIDEMLRSVRTQLDEAAFAESVLLLPQSIQTELTARLHGAPTADDWVPKFGIAAGTVLAATSQLAPLTQLKRQPPTTKPTRFGNLSETLSDRRTAFKVILACLAIAILAPVAFSGLRLLILNVRYPGLHERLHEIEDSKQKLAMYADLKDQAWSMTKILSDLVVSAPEGIELESIAIDHGKELRIKGTARSQGDLSASEVILKMQSTMQEFGVFTQVRPSWDNPNAMQTTFDFSLVALVADPHKEPNYPDELDFAGMTLADRKYGKQQNPAAPSADVTAVADSSLTTPGATNPDEIPEQPDGMSAEKPSDDTSVAMDDPARDNGRRPLNEHTSRADDTVSHSGDGGAADVNLRVPEPRSDGQIAAMSKAEAQDAFAEVAKAIRRAPNLKAETRDRLMHEFKQLQERLRELSR